MLNSENDTSEVDNCQVLGWGNGKNAKEAFDNFKKENLHLQKLLFNSVIGAELKNNNTHSFNLKK